VRSVEIGADNNIYVGGQDELGYFIPGQNGNLQYHSMTSSIPEKDRNFGDVWDIVSFQKSIFFRSINNIFQFTNEAAAVYHPISEWAFMGVCNNQLLAQDYATGLMTFINESWQPVQQENIFPTNVPVTGVLPMQSDSIIITTLKSGFFLFTRSGITKIPLINNALFENERIYAATPVNKDWIALATSNNGIFITDWKGNIIQQFSVKEGIQNNNVLSIFLDRQSNLWLGLDNGIDLIVYNSAIKQINPAAQHGSGYTSIINDNQLYIGTSNGLYSVPLQTVNDLSFSKGDFQPVLNTKGQTWGLSSINKQLLLGHHEGAFVIKDNKATPISSETGFWNFVPLSQTFPTSKMVAGNYKGLAYFDFINGAFVKANDIPGFTESSRYVCMDKYDQLWVSHPYHGVYKIARSNTGEFIKNPYSKKNGLPSLLNNHVYKIKNEVLLATENGILVYDQQTDRFEPSSYYQKLLGKISIRYMKEDASGNIWFIHEKSLGVIDISAKDPQIIYLPELNNKMLSGFEFIYPVNEKNIFLGGEKGFFHINYEKYRKNVPDLQVQIRSVKISNQTDSLLFGGYFKGVNEKQIQDKEHQPGITNDWKTIHLEYTSPLFGYQSNLEYSYKLKGYDENWSAWSKRTEK
jgi:ligand-binding sensor domain-containing protein